MTRIAKILIILMAFGFAGSVFADNVVSDEWKACAREAQKGDAEAQYKMGMMYKEGDAVVKNPAEAFYWFKKAASNGNGDAMYEVGRCFRDGDGVIADNRIAAENFWRAAEKGSAKGAYSYAEMLRDGVGVAQDKGKAYRWFSKAAEEGFSDARQQAEKLKGFANVRKTEKSPTVSKTTAKNHSAHGKGKKQTRNKQNKKTRKK